MRNKQSVNSYQQLELRVYSERQKGNGNPCEGQPEYGWKEMNSRRLTG